MQFIVPYNLMVFIVLSPCLSHLNALVQVYISHLNQHWNIYKKTLDQSIFDTSNWSNLFHNA
jgi:hypothetical protein